MMYADQFSLRSQGEADTPVKVCKFTEISEEKKFSKKCVAVIKCKHTEQHRLKC